MTDQPFAPTVGPTGCRFTLGVASTAAPLIYVNFPGTAREVLNFYAQIFEGEVSLYTYEQFGRSNGPPNAIAHGMLTGPVALTGSDAAPGEPSLHTEGIMLSLLGTDEPAVLQEWFGKLSVGGRDIDPLALRSWGDWDGQVTDRYGLRWLIGYQVGE